MLQDTMVYSGVVIWSVTFAYLGWVIWRWRRIDDEDKHD